MRVTLDEVCTKATSKYAQKDLANMTGEYPVFGASGFIKNIGVYQQEKTYVAVVKDGAGIGRTMLLPGKSSVIGTMQYLLPKENVLPKFLYYAVKSMHLEKYYTGATIPHIYFKDYKKETFDLPEDTRQKEIINIFDKVELIIQSRKLQLKALDELSKSRFVEMFGDPVCNSMNLPTMKGIDIFRLTNGKFVPESKRYELGIPAYGGNGISWYTDAALIQKDTIVIGRVGFQSGNVHFAKGPLWITDNAMYINNFNAEKYDLFFMYYLMRYIDFTRFQDAGDLKKITQKPFMNMKYIMPVLSRQREYVAFVKQTDKSRLLFKCQLLQYHSIEDIIRGRNYG